MKRVAGRRSGESISAHPIIPWFRGDHVDQSLPETQECLREGARGTAGDFLDRPPSDADFGEKGMLMTTKRLTLQQRKEIFRELVRTQDQNVMTIPDSRRSIIRQFNITDAQLRQIEEEGTEKDWPPLNEPLQKVG
jgi:hypothetical protein